MPSSETATLPIFAFSHLNLQWGTQSKWCILWLASHVGQMMQLLQATNWSWGGGMWPSPELLKNFMCGLQKCLGQRTRGLPSSSHLPWDANVELSWRDARRSLPESFWILGYAGGCRKTLVYVAIRGARARGALSRRRFETMAGTFGFGIL